MTEEALWLKFSKQVKAKLKEITDPVALTNNRSYNALTDVISNVILFEINIDKKPWDTIPKAKVRLPTYEELTKEAEWLADPKQVAGILLEKIKDEVSWNDMSADSFHKETIKAMGLFSALKNYLE
jgi:hypothetical protein